MKFVRPVLTLHRFGSLLPVLGGGETKMAVLDETKVRKITAKPRPNFDLRAATADISKRFSETLKYLAR